MLKLYSGSGSQECQVLSLFMPLLNYRLRKRKVRKLCPTHVVFSITI